MDIKKLAEILARNHQPRFRINQIIKAVYGDGIPTFSEISNIPQDLREILEGKMRMLSFEADKILISSDKKSVKAGLKLKDENLIETVLLSANPGLWSACVSSQAGCPMNCAFCATGAGGFRRNLTAEEITDQILFWKQYMCLHKISGKISSVVYMGMGEPFLNWESVRASLKDLTDKKLFGFGARSISISTVGILGGINKLAADFPQINMAISLHFCDNPKRTRFMPANRTYNLERLKEDLDGYFKRSNRKVFLEYILFKGINDSPEDAWKLAEFVRRSKKPRLLHVNLIRYNKSAGGMKLESSGQTQSIKFKNYLLKNNINCTIRKSLGTDIQGACGQLVASYSPII
jgi:23S rRNA (adenine(2503)-C(2))-methyltransferase